MFKLEAEHFNGQVKIISQDKVFEDHRGFFAPSFRADEFAELGIPEYFVQDNHSHSVYGTVRGLHFQWGPTPMAKLMRVTRGAAYLVAVDLNLDSPTFLKWVGIIATEENRLQMWASAQFARGFAALTSTGTDVQYKCTALYDSKYDEAINLNDPIIGIAWPVTGNLIVSDRDKKAPTVLEYFSGLFCAKYH